MDTADLVIWLTVIVGMFFILCPMQELQDHENQISDIIYSSDLTQSETIQVIDTLCDSSKECKTDLLKKRVVKR